MRCARTVPDLFLLSIGNNEPSLSVPVHRLHLSHIDNDRFLSMVYSAADLYVICSVQDNLPNTVLEAMACGLPVVGFDTGGIPDMVRTGVNGVTVPVAEPEALAAAITRVLNDPPLCAEMGSASRSIAVREHSLELQARRYAELYEECFAESQIGIPARNREKSVLSSNA
jgi:glycosyltransferase involved in cell wall biosynthesis